MATTTKQLDSWAVLRDILQKRGRREAAPQQLQRVHRKGATVDHRRDRRDRDRDGQHPVQGEVRKGGARQAQDRRDRRLRQQHLPDGGSAQEPLLLVPHLPRHDDRGGGHVPRGHAAAHRRPPGHGQVGPVPALQDDQGPAGHVRRRPERPRRLLHHQRLREGHRRARGPLAEQDPRRPREGRRGLHLQGQGLFVGGRLQVEARGHPEAGRLHQREGAELPHRHPVRDNHARPRLQVRQGHRQRGLSKARDPGPPRGLVRQGERGAHREGRARLHRQQGRPRHARRVQDQARSLDARLGIPPAPRQVRRQEIRQGHVPRRGRLQATRAEAGLDRGRRQGPLRQQGNQVRRTDARRPLPHVVQEPRARHEVPAREGRPEEGRQRGRRRNQDRHHH